MGDSDAEKEAMAVIDAVGDSSGGVAASENADKAQADMQEVLDMANMFDEDGGDDDFAYGFGDCTDAGDDSVARAVAEKVAEAKKLCMLCEVKPRCKNQLYGPCCSADVRGAHNQAKRRGEAQLKAFQAIKKRGGKEFIACIMGFKSECAGCVAAGF